MYWTLPLQPQECGGIFYFADEEYSLVPRVKQNLHDEEAFFIFLAYWGDDIYFSIFFSVSFKLFHFNVLKANFSLIKLEPQQ